MNIEWGPLYCPANFPQVADMKDGDVLEHDPGRFIRKEGGLVRQGRSK